MADNNPVILSWLVICMGIISVFVGIGLLTWINGFVDLSIPPYIISAVGAAIGVAAWMVWNFRGKAK
jgi:hypothetical protein